MTLRATSSRAASAGASAGTALHATSTQARAAVATQRTDGAATGGNLLVGNPGSLIL
jgi:hypothetical protein